MQNAVLAFVDDIYEDLELWYPKLRLEEAGYAVRLVAPEIKTYSGKHGYPAKADLTLEEARSADFVGLLIPGGFMPDKLRRNAKVLSLTRVPLKLPGDQSAFQAGLCAAIAGVAGLFIRGGVLVDVSAADVWASFYTGVEVALAHFKRHNKRRAGHRVSGQPYPRTIFRCKDGYFAIQCGESRHWQSFL